MFHAMGHADIRATTSMNAGQPGAPGGGAKEVLRCGRDVPRHARPFETDNDFCARAQKAGRSKRLASINLSDCRSGDGRPSAGRPINGTCFDRDASSKKGRPA